MQKMTMNDVTLRQHIIAALEFEPSLDAVHIGIAVEDGIVTLTGHVRSYAEKLTVELLTQRIRGVRAVAEEIEVRFPEDKKTADDEIARRALSIIAWDTTIPDDTIKLKVQNGWITLTGEVEWHFQRAAAESAIRRLTGVAGVINLLSIRPRLDLSNIQSCIEGALKRDAEIEAGGINIKVSGSKVILEGSVHAWRERRVAERAAWATPGVTAVEDHLAVI
jgi:osmotically-inducible protein OsmY